MRVARASSQAEKNISRSGWLGVASRLRNIKVRVARANMQGEKYQGQGG